MSDAISPLPGQQEPVLTPSGPGGGGNRRVAVRHNACGLGESPRAARGGISISRFVRLPLGLAVPGPRPIADQCWQQVRNLVDCRAGIPDERWEDQARLLVDVGTKIGCKLDNLAPQRDG
jgi:hypothetical protein